MNKKLLFFGNERLATGVTTTAPTLQALLAAGYEVLAVIVAQSQTGASRQARELEVGQVAKAHGIPVLAPDKLNEAGNQLAAFGAAAGILVSYGKLVPQAVIDLFPEGIINIHPSLLPKHRGPTPLESTILKGDKETGVSLMRLTAQMDAGPVFAQETVLLRGDELKQVLAEQLLNIGKDMLLAHLPAILDGSLKPVEQSGSPTYDQRISKAHGELQFSDKPATELAREVRAFAGWPRSRTLIGTTEVIITAAHAAEAKGLPGTLWLADKQLGIHAKDGVLIIDKLIPNGKKEMPAQAFLAGYHP